MVMGYSFSGSFSYRLVVKMKALKANLEKWNIEVFGNAEVKKDRALVAVEFWDMKEKSTTWTLEELKARKQRMTLRIGSC